jgi:hypothetical protein
MRVLELSVSVLVFGLLASAASCGGSEFSEESGGSSGTAGSSNDGSVGSGGLGSGGKGTGGGNAPGGTDGSGGTGGSSASGGTDGSGGDAGQSGGGSGGNPTGGSGGNPTGGTGGNPGGTGGMSSGGSGGGTSGTGGTSSGGSGGGTSGSGGGGTGGITSVPPECGNVGDCVLHTDCCTCTGIAKGQLMPLCPDITCLIDQCTSMGISEVSCYRGQCIANIDCDLDHVTCGDAEPVCPPGQVHSVANDCFGPCVDPSDCKYVARCDQCKDSQACVKYTKGGTTVAEVRCLEVPPLCVTSRSCACMGSYACVAPNDVCSQAGDSLVCDCPTC